MLRTAQLPKYALKIFSKFSSLNLLTGTIVDDGSDVIELSALVALESSTQFKYNNKDYELDTLSGT